MALFPLSTLFLKILVIASMGDHDDDMVPKVLPKCQLECGEHGLEGMIHPGVVAIPNYQEAVDPSFASQELNHFPNVLCILVVRVIEAGGIYDRALNPICDPEP